MIRNNQIDGACAEAGVFEGDFAKYINEFFPERSLYLFDTFEGFSEIDIKAESEMGMSDAGIGDYNETSVIQVMEKMPNKDRVILVKGYFPETAVDIKENFCFINLDLDLYLPTINGLNWAKYRMVKEGVVLVHDYFSDVFMGPRKAVDEFIKANPRIKGYPIGDGISIMLTGFDGEKE